ncbi:amphi-Trp domain-containing protein [Marinobacterium sp. AK62]|uniref:Amphi-Trp domain-containing protein n=1 Tax=Marinobacterium alkalitolerans TaxID=1542925 RepID=A0ABS3Z6E5_9GAMM|nr:amphi-Trp domain-containing protein [Marinobacterium alkalitolerans]MBP0047253.1 amphi-Trp domain-containing protein [Marinobacterium alkalitolerans]
MPSKNEFVHESYQDGKSIQGLLKAIARGLGKGKLEFSDGDQTLELTPGGLLHLKVSASEDETRHQLSIRIRWEEHPREPSEKLLDVK